MTNETGNATLADALDKVLEIGAVINGEVMLKVADVDLVYLGLRLILTSVSRAEELSGGKFGDTDKETGRLMAIGPDTAPTQVLTPEDMEYIEKLQSEIKRAQENIPRLIDLGSPKKAEQGLAKLVLTLVELIRKLMEKEAFRRVKKGTLSPLEVQKLGLSLKAVKLKIKELQAVFGIEDDELNIDLGPLGSLL